MIRLKFGASIILFAQVCKNYWCIWIATPKSKMTLSFFLNIYNIFERPGNFTWDLFRTPNCYFFLLGASEHLHFRDTLGLEH